jgi:hypothetical protein
MPAIGRDIALDHGLVAVFGHEQDDEVGFGPGRRRRDIVAGEPRYVPIQERALALGERHVFVAPPADRLRPFLEARIGVGHEFLAERDLAEGLEDGGVRWRFAGRRGHRQHGQEQRGRPETAKAHGRFPPCAFRAHSILEEARP